MCHKSKSQGLTLASVDGSNYTWVLSPIIIMVYKRMKVQER